jgi:transcriptional regulator with GAF, ATPase, and Fis domain
MQSEVLMSDEAYFEDRPKRNFDAAGVAPMSPLRMMFLEAAKTLVTLRDKESIRAKLFNLICSITPADRVAVYVGDSLSGRDRGDSGEPVGVDRNAVEHVMKHGQGILSNQPPNSIVCVPLEAFDHRMGVIYAESIDADNPLTDLNFNLLSGIGHITALAFENAAHFERLQERYSRLEREVTLQHDLVGNSAPMAELAKLIGKAAPANSTVLIQGESGTGKELVARAIHRKSRRSEGPFVPVNCAALTESLLESQLFGHEKGAFTGAVAQQKGEFELAAGGTLFLDEVGELSLSIQAKLLRALQEFEIKRVGGSKPIRVDVRVITATNRDLDKAVATNEFRQDLLYRLKVLPLKTPSLRERREDIPMLARHFLRQSRNQDGRVVRAISPEAERILINYDWPGNVRELQNAIERALVFGSSDMILPNDLPSELFEAALDGTELPKYQAGLNATKRDLIEKALVLSAGDVKQAASMLDVDSSYVHRLARNFKLTHLIR